jgi:V/A-type H+-transporting ATPase subunit E
MGLEDIFRALEEQAAKDSEAVLAEARAHADSIIEEAENEAARAREHHVSEAQRSARSRSAQELNSAKLDARKRIAAVKEQAVRQVFDQALEQLAKVREGSGYREAFSRLADEALEGVSGEFAVLVDPADVDLANAVLAEKGISAEVRGDLVTTGGLAVSTEGGRVMRRNTLEDRLDKLRGLAQADVAEILFS